MSTSAVLELSDHDGARRGSMFVDCLPGGERWQNLATLENVDPVASESGGSGVRLLEETDYRFRIEIDGGAAIASLEPRELFSSDSYTSANGRLRTRRVTGTVRVAVTSENGERYTCNFEVRSRKLNYETEYRRMMLRLAEEGAELLQSSFAAGSFGGFEPDQIEDARTLYQRFAFLESLLDSELFAEAVEVIRYRPHSEHSVEAELVNPARYLKPDRSLARQLTRPAERQPLHRAVAGMRSIPRTVTRQTHIESLDTVPNQFVRFALEHWKVLANQVSDLLSGSGAEEERGRREALRIGARLEQLLAIPAVAEAGPLRRFPSANTVLNARVGYREIFRAFLVGDVAASLTWDGGADVFSAGKRDVATLYEYWVFLELARLIERLPGFNFNRSELVTETDDGMNLQLRRGHEVVLRGAGQRRGREVHLELWFNRTFSHGSGRDSTWTVQMRPDCSLRIQPAGGGWDTETWVHFDAKYRIAGYAAFLDSDLEPEGEAPATSSKPARAKSDDLRKMHAYRDAIRRTAGAYVLYPGGDDGHREPLRQYHEVLPGLGAFVLRPAENGEASVVAGEHLGRFLSDVIDHAASQGTHRERARYWEDVSYVDGAGQENRYDFQEVLDRPPADSVVLLGFVRSPAHMEWIKEHRLYNLRADSERAGSVTFGSPVVRAQFSVLYDSDGEVALVYRTTGALFVRSGADLMAIGYPASPDSGGTNSMYLCLELGELVDLRVTGASVRALAPTDGSPMALTWDAMAHALAPR